MKLMTIASRRRGIEDLKNHWEGFAEVLGFFNAAGFEGVQMKDWGMKDGKVEKEYQGRKYL